jgi:hypothetical protein
VKTCGAPRIGGRRAGGLGLVQSHQHCCCDHGDRKSNYNTTPERSAHGSLSARARKRDANLPREPGLCGGIARCTAPGERDTRNAC